MANIEKLVGTESPFEVGKKINEIIEKLGGLPVGFILWGAFSDDYVPENTLKTDGTEFTASSGKMFNNLWNSHILAGKVDTCSYSEYQTEVTMTGSCWKFAVDTTKQKFKIPFIPDKVFVDIADTVGVRGTGMTMGLTNGTNTYGLGVWTPNNNATMTAYTETLGKPVGTVASGSRWSERSGGLVEDTETSGIVADTTSAKTYKTIKHYVVVATGSINQSEADWSEFASSLASKANTDLSNVTASGKSKTVSWNIPDYSKQIEIEVVKGVNTYTAPKDGVIYGGMTASSTKKTMTINGIDVFHRLTTTGYETTNFFFQVAQGDVVVLDNYSLTNNTRLCFAPMKGAN